MTIFIRTWARRAACSVVALVTLFFLTSYWSYRTETDGTHRMTDGELSLRLFALPTLGAGIVLALTTLLAANMTKAAPTISTALPAVQKPYMAQVVGLQWLNPLQRRDYPAEWQLLWTMGLAWPNKDDDKVKSNPKKYGTLQSIADIASGINGTASLKNYHYSYLEELTHLFRDIYFTDSDYFYNAHSLKDKTTWRELAGIHVEYALPGGKLDPVEAAGAARENIIKSFDIGNQWFPNSWTRSTPPDVRLTIGGPNAGFTSLAAGLDYLQAHPAETVWVMNWDAPSRPKDAQINENMVLLVLAGPDYKTDRAPLAWLPYPAVRKASAFEASDNGQSRPLQAWKAALDKAAANAGIQKTSIGFVIHDAANLHRDSSDRLAVLARTMTEEVPELDFMKQTFNTPALLGEMGAGTALTNVALAIAYANHFGKNVLVAGTTDHEELTATVVLPPPVVRPIIPDAPWFRARGGNHAYLPWWGLRNDAPPTWPQGFSQ
ncbi:hypothetical protein [Massilia sp. S19_KUP03_FR1]|uniref:hypothetical protein n=1 Tax=Massilia sp. S19_KUP03_FR1 TaxID=3025503 RepID=UPI002FCDBE9A